MSPQAALEIMAARARSIKTVSAQGSITLKARQGSVRLDAALVLRPPDDARLRAWKLGHAVFDLTLTPQAIWVMAPLQKPTSRPAGATDHDTRQRQVAGAFARSLVGAISGVFLETASQIEEADGRLYVTQSLPGGMSMRCAIDRPTLTARQFTLRDVRGAPQFELTFDHYAMIAGIAWPRRIRAESPWGRIIIELSDIEINGEISPIAFKPPARSQRIDLPADVPR